MTQSARAEYRKTFKAACAQRVRDRAYDLMWKMQRDEAAAQAATGSNALVVHGYFKQLAQENEAYFLPTAEQQARYDEADRQRKIAEEARRNALTQAERDKEDKALERQRAKDAKCKGPRVRSLRVPIGNGTSAGRAAGDSVKLRQEIR